MNIILIGKPGAGKGYISKYLKENYGFTHISTGDICRKNIKEQTSLGKEVEDYCKQGKLVPLNLILQMLKLELKKNADIGFVFDGFPRTVEQAEELDLMAKIDIVLLLDVPDKHILERISKRRICPVCSKIYSLDEVEDERCPVCGEKLIIRADDDLNVAQNRLKVYEKETKPLVDYYKDKLVVIDNSGNIEQTCSKINEIIQKLLQNMGENIWFVELKRT